MDQKDILTTVTDSQFFEAQELLDALRIQMTKKPESPGFRIAQKKETFVFPTLVHLGQPIQPVLPVSLTTIRRQEHSRYRRDR
uniref:Reverse transcriptase domain-containing protein n=1 Tax=Steinernema glaseri TaxID=37863 RepID=A0A1I7ZQZ7_9BILA